MATRYRGSEDVLQVEGCSVSRAMADEAEETEKAARATLEAKQASLAQQGLDAKFAAVSRELEDLQRQAAALRKVGPWQCSKNPHQWCARQAG